MREWPKRTMEGDSARLDVARDVGVWLEGVGGWKPPKIARSHVCCSLGELRILEGLPLDA